MNHTNTPIFIPSKLSVINATMAYAMYKKPVTNPYTLETSGNLPVHSDILRVYRGLPVFFVCSDAYERSHLTYAKTLAPA